jgi:hypothetical protein
MFFKASQTRAYSDTSERTFYFPHSFLGFGLVDAVEMIRCRITQGIETEF